MAINFPISEEIEIRSYIRYEIIIFQLITSRQLQRVILLDTSEQYMLERSISAGNVTTRQLKKLVSLDTSKLFMRERAIANKI